MEGKNAIQIENLVKRYGNGSGEVIAVDNLTLTIFSGELFGLLGPNGAGKSTTINILCGLNTPTSGKCAVADLDVKEGANKIKAIIGVSPQEPSVFPYLSGKQNLELFGNLHTLPKDTLKERVAFLLDKLNLTDAANRQVRTYSGGMLRRIHLAIALINNPEIVFLDEPTVAMDPQSRRAVWDLIVDLKVKGKTVILTTHYIEEADALCDRVGIIDQGKIIALGKPAELKAQYHAKTLEDVFIQLTGRRIREEN